MTRLASVVTDPSPHAAGASQLLLSTFPGIDLLGRGFEAEGFSVVRGPDLIYGGDMHAFHVPPGRFDGVIGGPPCPDFSRVRRSAPTGNGLAMLAEFERVVIEAAPAWWLMENVPGVPDVRIAGYSWLRMDLDPRDFGAAQSRLRHFQFGHRGEGGGAVPIVTRRLPRAIATARCCLAAEGARMERRTWADFCELQGLPRDFELPGMTLAARYRAVGNGVHVLVARALAAAIRDAVPADSVRLCRCDCGRVVSGKQTAASASCRKRLQRKRDEARGVTAWSGTLLDDSRVPELAPACRGTSQEGLCLQP